MTKETQKNKDNYAFEYLIKAMRIITQSQLLGQQERTIFFSYRRSIKFPWERIVSGTRDHIKRA